MKNLTLLARLCALVLVASCLFACAGEGSGAATTPGSTTAGTTGSTTAGTTQATTGAWETFDGAGETLKFDVTHSTDPTHFSYNAGTWLWGPDQVGSDSVLNLIYERNTTIGQRLNLKIEYIENNVTGSAAVQNRVQTQVLSSSGPDMFCSQTYGMYKATFQGYFANALDTTEENYIDLSVDGWNGGYSKSLSLMPEEKVYLLSSDYFLDIYRYINAMLVNVKLLNEGLPESGIDALYDTVMDGKWTYDTLMDYCERLNQYSVGTGEQGIAGMVLYITPGNAAASVFAETTTFCADISFYDMVDGKFTPRETVADAVELADKILELYATPGVKAVTGTSGASTDDLTQVFATGGAVFCGYHQLRQFESDIIGNMEKVTVVPVPKVAEDDEYTTLTRNCGMIGGISVSTAKFAELTAYLQAVSTNSSEIVREYTQNALKFKYATDIGTGAMLDIIYAGLNSEAVRGKYLENYLCQEIHPASYMPQVVEELYNSRTNTYSSIYGSLVDAKKTKLGEIYTKYVALP